MQSHEPPRRFISRVRWREYVRVLYPGLRLSRSKTDLCDRCVKIDTELQNSDITPERRSFLEAEKKMHVDDAVKQRKVWANFISDYVGGVDPNLHLAAEAFPLLMEVENDNSADLLRSAHELEEESSSENSLPADGPNLHESEFANGVVSSANAGGIDAHEDGDSKVDLISMPLVSLQAEDYGGSIALPHFGFRRPSSDYFNSNLMCYNFVLADITGKVNNVYLYDERDQGKGADALCSLRLRYHLGKLSQYKEAGVTPHLNMTLLDNCVGQNKSQKVMKFACLLSVLFYDTVALLYFLPGHTHMLPDRCGAA